MEQYGHDVLEAELAVQDQLLTPLGFAALRGNTVSRQTCCHCSDPTIDRRDHARMQVD